MTGTDALSLNARGLNVRTGNGQEHQAETDQQSAEDAAQGDHGLTRTNRLDSGVGARRSG